MSRFACEMVPLLVGTLELFVRVSFNMTEDQIEGHVLIYTWTCMYVVRDMAFTTCRTQSLRARHGNRTKLDITCR